MVFLDPYLDPQIGDLRNLLGACSSEELRRIEPQIVFANEIELESCDIPRTHNSQELLLIHVQLFKGVSQNFLQHLSTSVFVEKLAYFYDQLNYIHPFREGNGRTQRVFWGRVAQDAGYDIDWSAATSEENDKASRIAAEKMDTTLLQDMFRRIVKPV